MKKVLFALLGGVAVLAIAGAYFYPQSSLLGNSPVGQTFGTAKIAAKVWNLASITATSTSLYNYDQNDRVIESSFLACDTVGVSVAVPTLIRAATTTANAPAVVTNTVYASNLVLATSSSRFYVASSTDPTANAIGRTWPAGTYLTFFSSATNTAKCTVGVKYIER